MNSEKKRFDEYIFILQKSLLNRVENWLKIDVEVRQKSWHDLNNSWHDFGSRFFRHERSKSWCDFKDQV